MLTTMIFKFTSRLVLGIFELLLGAQPSRALVENRTIDDEYGDIITGKLPVYQGPQGQNWIYGPDCPGCGVQPYPPDTFDHTWHVCTAAATDPSPWNVTLAFDGTAIWVYFVTCNIIKTGLGVNTNITFTLDGHPSGTYIHIANPNSPAYEYNVTVFSSQNLSNSQHTLVVSTVGQSEPGWGLALFDWAMYTYENDTETSSTSQEGDRQTSGFIGFPSSTARSITESVFSLTSTTTGEVSTSTSSGNSSSTTSRSPVTAIVGSLVGGVAGLLALILAFLYLCRRIRSRAANSSPSVSTGHLLQTAHATAVQLFSVQEFPRNMRSEHTRDADLPPSAPNPFTAANPSTAANVIPPSKVSTRSYSSARPLPMGTSTGRGRRESFLQQADVAIEPITGTIPGDQNVGTIGGRTSAHQLVSTPFTVHDGSELQRRVDMLHAELDRMRVAVELPPAYDFEEEDR